MKINILNSRKSLFFILFLSSSSQLFAQKPKEGDWLTEIGISLPWGNPQYFYNSNVSTTNNSGYYSGPISSTSLNTRYFKKPNLAYRTGLSLGFYNNSYSSWGYNGAIGITFKSRQSNALLSFGIEKHLRTSGNKFSPFCLLGASAGFSAFRASHKGDSLSLGTNWGTWNGYYSYMSKQNSFNIGVIGLLGFDYWLNGDIYIGVEYGIYCNFQYSGTREQNLLRIINNSISSETVKIEKPSTSFNIGNYSNPQIRLGWRFYKSARLGG